MIVVAVFAYSRLPDRVPTHWNHKGEITSFGSKWMVVITMPALIPINVSARTLGIAGAAAAILTLIYSYFVWRQETSK